jgi:hypothetical protein
MKRTTVALAVVALLGLHLAADGEKFTEWSAPVNLGKIVNSPYAEAGAYISRDGLSLYFGSGRPGGMGPTNTFDIWVSHRESPASQWGVPVNVGTMVNTANNEQTPMLTIDGHRLYFARDGLGGYGSQDLYVSRRQHAWEDFGWRAPVNLGPGVNTTSEESGPAVFEDDATGILTLYFSSTRTTGLGCEDIYVSTAYPDEEFGTADLEPGLSGLSRDVRPFVRREGLEMYFDSNRPNASCTSQPDLWTSSRSSIWGAWSTPVKLPDYLNSTAVDARPVVSFDGTELYFHSNRLGTLGGNDIYACTRTKITGRDKK